MNSGQVKKTVTAVLFSLLFIMPHILRADEIASNISIGPVITAGLNDLYMHNMENVESEGPGYNAGGGLAIEKMFSNRFGINTGLVYSYVNIDFLMDGTTDAIWTYHMITIPFRLITSFNTENFSLNLLSGIKYTNIFKSEMKNESTSEIDDSYRFVTANQIALSAGINFKFRVGKYHDLFIGIEGDFYPTNMIRQKDSYYSESMHHCSVNLTAGYLIRTNIFPISGY